MKLTYRGPSYDAPIPAIEGTPTGEIATFRGRSYRIKQFNLAHRQRPGGELIYRGVPYTR